MLTCGPPQADGQRHQRRGEGAAKQGNGYIERDESAAKKDDMYAYMYVCVCTYICMSNFGYMRGI